MAPGGPLPDRVLRLDPHVPAHLRAPRLGRHPGAAPRAPGHRATTRRMAATITDEMLAEFAITSTWDGLADGDPGPLRRRRRPGDRVLLDARTGPTTPAHSNAGPRSRARSTVSVAYRAPPRRAVPGDEPVDRVLAGLDVDAEAAVACGLRRHRTDRDDERLRIAGTVPTRSQKFATVDDDVNVSASTAPLRTRSSVGGVRVRSDGPVDRAARRPRSRAGDEPLGEHVAGLLRPGEQHAGSTPVGRGKRVRAATRRRSARVRGRDGHPARASAAAVPGPIAATPYAASARASRPGGREPTVEERAHAVHRREHDPRVGRRGRAARSRGARSAIDGSSSTSAPSTSSRARSSLACSRARVTTTRAPEQGPRLEPREVERGDVADDDRARRLARRRSAIVASVVAGRALVGAGAVADRGDRGLGEPARTRSGAARCRRCGPRPSGSRACRRRGRAPPSRRRCGPWPDPRDR